MPHSGLSRCCRTGQEHVQALAVSELTASRMVTLFIQTLPLSPDVHVGVPNSLGCAILAPS